MPSSRMVLSQRWCCCFCSAVAAVFVSNAFVARRRNAGYRPTKFKTSRPSSIGRWPKVLRFRPKRSNLSKQRSPTKQRRRRKNQSESTAKRTTTTVSAATTTNRAATTNNNIATTTTTTTTTKRSRSDPRHQNRGTAKSHLCPRNETAPPIVTTTDTRSRPKK